jgi:transaldolase
MSTQLRFFLDTADIPQWQIWLPTGMFYGVTTNPLLLKQVQCPCTIEQLTSMAQQAFELGVQEIQLQTWGTTVQALVTTGLALAAIDPRVVVKVPITSLGTEAAARLIERSIRVTLTGVYAAHQVLIAAALRADYAAPYLGRMNDLGQNGRDDLIVMQRAIAGVNSSTRILVASIRNVEDMTVLATHGVNTFTFSPKIAAEFFNVAATNQAAIDFEAAASP